MLFIVPVLYTPLKRLTLTRGNVVHLHVVVNYVDFTRVNITFVYTKYLIEANVSRNMDMKYRVYIKTTTIEMEIIFCELRLVFSATLAWVSYFSFSTFVH